MVLRYGAARGCATRRASHIRGAGRMDRGHRFAGEYPAYRGDRSPWCAPHAASCAERECATANARTAAGGAVMAAPKRRLTPAERDRALRLRGRLTKGFGVFGTTAVAALALLAAHTHAGSTTAGSAVTTSSNTTTTTTTTPASTSTSTGSSSLSTGSATSGSSSSASTVSGGS